MNVGPVIHTYKFYYTLYGLCVHFLVKDHHAMPVDAAPYVCFLRGVKLEDDVCNKCVMPFMPLPVETQLPWSS